MTYLDKVARRQDLQKTEKVLENNDFFQLYVGMGTKYFWVLTQF